MAKLPSVKSLLPEAFKEQSGWIMPLISTLNSFMRSVVDGLNKKLTIADNFDGEIKTFVASGSYPVKLKWERTSKPTIGLIGNIARVDGSPVTITTACMPIWKFTQGSEIEISDIAGLDDTGTKKYNVTVVFLVG